jgi:glycosyltransferase involved in cell wall biosynthesis
MVVRNCMPLLAATIESVLSQTGGVSIEFLIGDDASCDGSFEECVKYAEQDPRIKLFRGDRWRGKGVRLHQLLARSRATFTSIIQPGDILDPSALDEMCRVLERNSKVTITSCGYRLLANQGKLIRTVRAENANQFIEARELIRHLLLSAENPLPPLAASLFRRGNLEIIYNSKYHALGQLIFWCSVLNQDPNRLYYGLDRELVSIRFFDFWEAGNRAEESLCRLAEHSRLKTWLSYFSIDDKNQGLDTLLDKLGVKLIQTGLHDVSQCVRALQIHLGLSADEEVAPLVDALFSLSLNRMHRKHYLAARHQSTTVDLRELQRELELTTGQTEKILNSQSWKLTDKARAIKRSFAPTIKVASRPREIPLLETPIPQGKPQCSAGSATADFSLLKPRGGLTVIVPVADLKELDQTVDSLSHQSLKSIDLILMSNQAIEKDQLSAMEKALNCDVRVVRFGSSWADHKALIAHFRSQYFCIWSAQEEVSGTYLERGLFLGEREGIKLIAIARAGNRTDRLLSGGRWERAIHGLALSRVIIEKELLLKDELGKSPIEIVYDLLQRYPLKFLQESGTDTDAKFPSISRNLPSALPPSIKTGALEFRPHRASIVMCLPFLVAGSESFFGHLVELLQERGEKVVVVTTNTVNPSLGDSTAFFEKIPCPVYHLPRFLDNQKQMWRFFFELLERNQEATIMQIGSDFIYKHMAQIKEGFPKIRIVDQLFNEVGHTLSNKMYRESIDTTIVPSQLLKNILISKFAAAEEHVLVLPHGIPIPSDEELQHFGQSGRALLPPQFNNKFVVSFFGRFAREKQPEFFVEIANQLSRYSDIVFFMAGDGPLKERVTSSISKYALDSRIYLPGFIKDVNPLMSVTDVVVIPSSEDGMPLVMMEAQSHKKPIVASRVGSIPIVIEDNVSGFICESGALESFVDRIERLYHSPDERIRLGEAGRANVCANYSEKKMVESYISLFRHLHCGDAARDLSKALVS